MRNSACVVIRKPAAVDRYKPGGTPGTNQEELLVQTVVPFSFREGGETEKGTTWFPSPHSGRGGKQRREPVC